MNTYINSPVARARSLPSYPSPVSRQLPIRTAAPFVLCFIQGNITTCFGCKQKYIKPCLPPEDLCVRHEEWRTFYRQGTPTCIPHSITVW